MYVLTLVDCKTVIDGEIVECEIQIENEKIVEIKKIISGEKGVVLSAKGLIVIPGIIDSHAHILDPVIPFSNFKNASEMALLGGVTTILEMPTDKPILSKDALLEKLKIAYGESIVDFGFHLGNFKVGYKEQIREVKEIVRAIKGFTCAPYKIENLDEFFIVAKETSLLPMLHSEDENVLREKAEEMRGKLLKPADYSLLRPDRAEKIAVENALRTATGLGTQLHIVHLSSKEGVEVLRKQKGEKHTVEVCPHHLVFTRKDLVEKGSLLKMNPPLREKEDVEALWDALIGGLIDFVATDHFYTPIERKLGPIEQVPAGIPGLEALCPIIFTYGVKKRGMSIPRFVEITSTTPAARFGLKRKGKIKKNMDADIVLLNPKMTKKFRSKFWSPYEGMELTGYPEVVMLRGKVVLEHGEICGKPGNGKFLFDRDKI